MVRPWIVITFLCFLLSQATSALRFSVTDTSCTEVTWDLALSFTEWNSIYSVQLWLRNVPDAGLASPVLPISRDYVLSGSADIREAGVTTITTQFPSEIQNGSYQLGLYIFAPSDTDPLRKGRLIESLADRTTRTTSGCQVSSVLSSSATVTPPTLTSTISPTQSSASNSQTNTTSASSGRNKGKIVGAIVGSLLGTLALILAILAFIFIRRKRQVVYQEEEKRRVAVLATLARGGQGETNSYSSTEDKIDVIQALATIPSKESVGAWMQQQVTRSSLTGKRSMQSLNYDVSTSVPGTPTIAMQQHAHARSYTSLSVSVRSESGDARSLRNEETGMATTLSRSQSKTYKIRRVNVPSYEDTSSPTHSHSHSHSRSQSASSPTMEAEPVEFVDEDGPSRVSFSSFGNDDFRSAEDLPSMTGHQGLRKV